ncbi:MAG: ABC transporter ATP-binding protein [Deltaproteobacteria bacterium]|nr:ABC transporter ATP-binding protein [Deltaproteobacteria bacterium]
MNSFSPETKPTEQSSLLRVEGLVTVFHTDQGPLRAVDGVSFAMRSGSTLGLVGESGCGKSATALSIMRLIPPVSGKIADGNIWFDGTDLLGLDESEMRRIRGNRISMIFQEPMTSLNPVYPVGDQVGEMFRAHRKMNRADALDSAVQAMRSVGIPDPEQRVSEYPHQMSGGMRQRVMIAMAMACEPELIIADEPTTALDTTIQAQILSLMNELKTRKSTALLLITHDLGVVSEMADDVIVMYAGRVFESARVESLFDDPLHPYTVGLLNSVPGLGRTGKLEAIPGTVPGYFELPGGCKFSDRCPDVFEPCSKAEPELYVHGEDHRLVRCYKYDPEWS